LKSMIRYNGLGHTLTSKQRKLIKFIVKSASMPSKGPLNISELCSGAGVSTKVWYGLIEDPNMKEVLPAAIDYLLGMSLIPVIQKLIERALAGSAKHSELFLKLCDLLQPDAQTKILQVFGKEGQQGTLLTSEQIRAMIEGNK